MTNILRPPDKVTHGNTRKIKKRTTQMGTLLSETEAFFVYLSAEYKLKTVYEGRRCKRIKRTTCGTNEAQLESLSAGNLKTVE
jgi:hypothetical protein